MRAVFADTFYFFALLSAKDEAHAAAHHFAAGGPIQLVTTAWVLTELADGLAGTAGRRIFADFLAELGTDPTVEIIHSDAELWRRGAELYADRTDKKWSLTDCISFIVMRDRAIGEALTADHHFEQAGFRALLK